MLGRDIVDYDVYRPLVHLADRPGIAENS